MMKGVKALSKIGVGTGRYVIPDHSAHKSALMTSLVNGINVIDTSTSYGEGESETLIGNILKEYDSNIEGSDFEKFKRSNFHIISKYGCSMGESIEQNYGTEEKRKKYHLKPLPRFEDCFYSFHPDYLEKELTMSLSRLQTPYLDSYLIQNPEAVLNTEIPLGLSEEEIPKYREKAVDLLYEKLNEAFEGLEKEVKKGRIRSYGISSNAFSYLPDDPYFMPYTEILNIAKKASESVHGKGKPHSFQYVQFPGNILERNGLHNVAPWAREQNLNVLVVRPLNAYDANGDWRLASYPSSSLYKNQYQNNLALFAARNPHVAAILRDLDGEKTNYTTIAHLQEDLSEEILPALLENVPDVDENESAWISLSAFLLTYETEVKHYTSLRAEQYVEGLGIGYKKGTPLQQFALKFLVDNPNVTCVINGITDQSYVEDALPFLEKNPE